MNTPALNFLNCFKFEYVKYSNVIKFDKIQIPKIKILKLTYGTYSNDSYYNELFTKIPNHSQR